MNDIVIKNFATEVTVIVTGRGVYRSFGMVEADNHVDAIRKARRLFMDKVKLVSLPVVGRGAYCHEVTAFHVSTKKGKPTKASTVLKGIFGDKTAEEAKRTASDELEASLGIKARKVGP